MNTAWRVALVIAATMAVPALANGQAPIPVELGEGLCQGVQNGHQCALAVERHQLGLSRGRVERVAGALVLHLFSGRSVRLLDQPESDTTTLFTFVGYSAPLGYFVIRMQYWEGSAILLVNARTGWMVTVDELPIPAPDRRRFVTASIDQEAQYNPTRLVVWRITPDSLVKEWELASQEWGPGQVRWLSSRELTFAKLRLDSNARYVTVGRDTARLSARRNWAIRSGR
jgi:hypothetical protein